MKAIRLLGAFLIILAALSGCEKNSNPVSPGLEINFSPLQKNVLDRSQNFGLRLFQHIAHEQPDSNLFLSPFSISCALVMTLNGAAGETRQAIRSTLGVEEISLAQLNQAYRQLQILLPRADPQVSFALANSVWYDATRFEVNPAFAATMEKNFFARVAGLDFSSPEAVSTINAWVNQATKEKIPSVLKEIDRQERLFLMNAIYFQAHWSLLFDPQQTHSAPFFLSDSHSVQCQMMTRKGEFNIAHLENTLILDLPYGNDLFSMTILLPDPGIDLEDFLVQLDGSRLHQMYEALQNQEIILEMPRFAFRNNLKLKAILAAMGMGIAFDPQRADFSLLGRETSSGGNLYLTRVLHNAFIQVDEEGTEAAAATTVAVGVTSVPGIVRLNRPFVFLIREKIANTVLFIGKLEEPVWQQ